MAWPFSNSSAPNVDSGIVAIPLTSTAVPGVAGTDAIWLVGASFANTGAADATVRVTDGSGASIMPDIDIPSKSVVTMSWPFMPLTGLKWLASVTPGINGKIWGYK